MSFRCSSIAHSYSAWSSRATVVPSSSALAAQVNCLVSSHSSFPLVLLGVTTFWRFSFSFSFSFSFDVSTFHRDRFLTYSTLHSQPRNSKDFCFLLHVPCLCDYLLVANCWSRTSKRAESPPPRFVQISKFPNSSPPGTGKNHFNFIQGVRVRLAQTIPVPRSKTSGVMPKAAVTR